MPPPHGLLLNAIVALTVAIPSADDPLPVPRLEGRITLDGVPDEAAWQAIAPLPMVGFAPGPVGEVVRLRGRVAVSTALSADLLLQHASTPRRSGVNLRLHYHVREGTSVRLAMNHSQADVSFPRAADGGPARAVDRALVVKFIRTFGTS